jgi:DNA ligase (NAD+)
MEIKSHNEELKSLKKIGFAVSETWEIIGTQKIWEKMEEVQKNKNKFKYFIDGIVVKIDNNELVKKLGNIGKTPRGWCALKFETKEVVTKVLDVSWQVGRTGKITPVVELEPTELLGTIVKRATLHNYQRFLEIGLSNGDFVIIRKAGDIIPEVVSKISN